MVKFFWLVNIWKHMECICVCVFLCLRFLVSCFWWSMLRPPPSAVWKSMGSFRSPTPVFFFFKSVPKVSGHRSGTAESQKGFLLQISVPKQTGTTPPFLDVEAATLRCPGVGQINQGEGCWGDVLSARCAGGDERKGGTRQCRRCRLVCGHAQRPDHSEWEDLWSLVSRARSGRRLGVFPSFINSSTIPLGGCDLMMNWWPRKFTSQKWYIFAFMWAGRLLICCCFLHLEPLIFFWVDVFGTLKYSVFGASILWSLLRLAPLAKIPMNDANCKRHQTPFPFRFIVGVVRWHLRYHSHPTFAPEPSVRCVYFDVLGLEYGRQENARLTEAIKSIFYHLQACLFFSPISWYTAGVFGPICLLPCI